MIPCAWVLMANRSAADKNLVFDVLKRLAYKNGLDHAKVTIDFEVAAIKAYHLSFPGKLFFCVFFCCVNILTTTYFRNYHQRMPFPLWPKPVEEF